MTDDRTGVKAFCVGQAKSGTASLAGLLAANHRSAHEPEREELLSAILRESRGELSAAAFHQYLLRRDARLNLEYDVAWANQFIIGHLLAVFPTAKFIILIRDPYTWLRSVTGHLVNRDVPPEVLAFLTWWFKPEQYPHSRHDRALAERGLFSLAAYLHAWNRHVDACTRSIPADRRLVLRTHELSRVHQRLADFLGIPADSLDADSGHLNRGISSGRIESAVDPAYLEEMTRSICGANLARYFPEINSAEDVPRLWSGP